MNERTEKLCRTLKPEWSMGSPWTVADLTQQLEVSRALRICVGFKLELNKGCLAIRLQEPTSLEMLGYTPTGCLPFFPF